MSTAGRAPSPAAPGVVQVRLLGSRPELTALAGLVGSLPGLEILTARGPCPNRYDPGERVYLTVRIDLPPGAAHGRQAGRRPAIPARRHPLMMSPDRLRDELTRRLDGPHADEHTTAAADLAAEAVRFLNYATGSHSGAGLRYPATVYALTANLAAAAHRMPQLCDQLTRWLESELAAGHLASDDRTPPDLAVSIAAGQLAESRAAGRPAR